MSLFIKGMKMPESCAFCRIKRRNGKKMVCPLCDEEWDVHDPMSADHRLDNCPLVPVPPHGRLIDADALKKHIDSSLGRVFTGVTLGEALKILVDEMPIIIPGDPAEEGE